MLKTILDSPSFFNASCYTLASSLAGDGTGERKYPAGNIQRTVIKELAIYYSETVRRNIFPNIFNKYRLYLINNEFGAKKDAPAKSQRSQVKRRWEHREQAI
jgi:hypothetical protein